VKLRVGDIVYLDGLVYTARDQAHKRAIDYIRSGKALPVDFNGSAVYHCGPIAVREGDVWRVLAAGPTTSMRMEGFEYEFIARLGARLIFGKGGMGDRTAEACIRYGAAIGDVTGGAAVVYARAIKAVRGVEWLDLGMPEALWIFEVEKFGPITITIDSDGRNLHDEIRRIATERKQKIFRSGGVSV